MQTPRAVVGISLLLAVLLPIGCGTVSPIAAQEKREQLLYDRLGRYDAIAAVGDDFLSRLSSDPQLRRFVVGHSTDILQRIRQLVVEQVCAAAGGPCVYTGRSMKTTHTGLGITEADWKASVAHLVASLDYHKVPSKEKD